MIVEAARGKMPGYVDTGLNVVHVDDVAAGQLLAAENGQGRRALHPRRREHGAGRDPRRGGEGGRPAPAGFKVPYAVVLPVAAGAELLARLTGREPFVTLDGVRMSRKKMYFSSAKAHRGSWATAPRPAQRGHRRRRRLVRGQRVSGQGIELTALATEAAHRAEHAGRNPVGQGARRREFPGRIVSDPARICGAHVHAFYRFARNADDIADNPDLAADDKMRRLDRMGEILEGAPGDDSPAASAMRASLRETGTTAQHCHDVLHAFRLDATKLRYRDWDDLMEYCRYSASPVGRQLLDLHGESRDTWPASDALCSALQVLNHLQDCADDYRELDRVYLPLDLMGEAGIGVEALTAAAASPGLRRVIDRLLDRTDRLIAAAAALPRRVEARGLRWESATIVDLAAAAVAAAAARRSAGGHGSR